MKLISTLRNRNTGDESKSIFSDDCSLGQALTMIESWCNDNEADYPRACDLWKNDGNIRINVYTKDHMYVNFFEITD
jgi:hypothetical protein